LAYLANLPLRIEAHGCTFVHASPDDPAAWKRLSSYPDTKAQFDHFDTDVCFVGHSHVPAVVGDKLGVFNVRPGHRYLVNVGSVGQPRDRNPNLSFAFFDTETFDHETVRLPYNVDAAAAKVVEAGLPRRLSKRLLVGQ
jgi:diadenosine tetraphosphatase ApaH/serine/threonine PP2A family protein phosphatase